MADGGAKPRQSKSTKRKKTALRELIQSVPEGDALFGILIGLMDNPRETEPSRDRTAAIVGATFIEYALRLAITRHLSVDESDPHYTYLFESDDAPYREFASRIRLARALGIISKQEFDEIELIRLIRNAFAHSISNITFTTPELGVFFDEFDLDYTKDPLDGFIELMEPKTARLTPLPRKYASRLTFVFIIFKHYWKLLTHSPKAFPEALDEALRQS